MYFQEIENKLSTKVWEYKSSEITFKLVDGAVDVKKVRINEPIKFHDQEVNPKLNFKDHFNRVIVFRNQEALNNYRKDKSEIDTFHSIWDEGGKAQKRAKYYRE